MRASVLRGRRVIVVSVTDGEKARPAEVLLRQRRRRELDEALSRLSYGDDVIEVVRLHLPDGDVVSHERSLRATKATALSCFRSQTESHPEGAIVPQHVLAHFTRPFESFILGAARP